MKVTAAAVDELDDTSSFDRMLRRCCVVQCYDSSPPSSLDPVQGVQTGARTTRRVAELTLGIRRIHARFASV